MSAFLALSSAHPFAMPARRSSSPARACTAPGLRRRVDGSPALRLLWVSLTPRPSLYATVVTCGAHPPFPEGSLAGLSRVQVRFSICMPWPEDPDDPGCLLATNADDRYWLRRTFKLSPVTSPMLLRGCTSSSGRCDSPYGLQISLCTLRACRFAAFQSMTGRLCPLWTSLLFDLPDQARNTQ